MRRAPWVKFSPADWLSGTAVLKAAERGICISLIMTMYERGKPLKNDVGRLARLCGASNSHLKATLDVLIDEGLIIVTDKGLWNNRVGKELGDLKKETGADSVSGRAKVPEEKDRKVADNQTAKATQDAAFDPSQEVENNPTSQLFEGRSEKNTIKTMPFLLDIDIDTELDISSLRSEISLSSVSSFHSETDSSENALSREIENLENQNHEQVSKNEKENPQTEKLPPLPEPEQQQTTANQQAGLGLKSFQVAPRGDEGGACREGGDDGVIGGNLALFPEKGRSDSLASVLGLAGVECQTGQENAPVSQKMANKGNSAASNRRPNYPSAFDEVWKAYPTTPNMSKKEGFEKWRRLDDVDKAAVARAIPEYVRFLKEKPDHPVVHFCRFISQRRFDGFVAANDEKLSSFNGKSILPKLEWMMSDSAQFTERQWQMIILYARDSQVWHSNLWGPMPREEGCICPGDLCRDSALTVGWRDVIADVAYVALQEKQAA